MKKITKVIALFLAVALMFSGCTTMEMKTTIKNDGTVDSFIKMEIDKEIYDAEAIKNNPDLFKTPEDVEKALKEQYTGTEDLLGTSVKVEVVTKEDNKQYYVISTNETSKMESGSEYGSLEGMMGFEDMYSTKDTVYITYDGSLMMEMINMYKELDPTLNFDANSIKLAYTYEFPYSIVSSQGGIIDETNPKAITFNLPLDGKLTAFATTNAKVSIDTVKAKIKKITTVKKSKIKSLKVKSIKKKGTVSLKLAKVKGATYEIQYSTSKKFTKKTTKTKTTKKTNVTIKKLKKGKKYYFRVRASKDFGLKTFYSKYSNKKSIKVVKKSKKK